MRFYTLAMLWRKTLWIRVVREEVPKVFVEFFFHLTVPKNFEGNSSMFQKNSGMEKIMGKRGVSPFFPRKNFCLIVPKKFSTGTFRCFRSSRVLKNFVLKGRGITLLRRKIFRLILPKNFLGDPSLFDKISGIEKFFA